jgi:hypothetical protein
MGGPVLAYKLASIQWAEGTTATLAAGNNDTTITLAKGTANQILRRVRIGAPGVIGPLAVTFYDNTPATTPISGTLYFDAQPPEGFDLSGLRVASGKLGIRITGFTAGGNSTAYINFSYTY